MKAIFKREMRAYFTTPIGYIFIGVFLTISGFLFKRNNLDAGYPSLDSVLYNLLVIFIFLIPILTMRLFSDERNKKTDQILLTSPVKVSDIVLGKFFAASAVYIITLVLTLMYLIVIAAHGKPSYSQVFCNYIGFALLGMTFISIGLFISSLTESQPIAAVATFGVLLGLFWIDSLKSTAQNPILSAVVGALSIMARFDEFNLGVLSVVPIVYYISITALFLFLTGLAIERRRIK